MADVLTGLELADIQATAALIAPYVLSTPAHTWRGREIETLMGAETEVVLKLELFQHAGSFKVRGALSNMLRLSDAQRGQGVTAVSAGNHAIAVAYAAAILGMSAKVVMLSTASPARIAAARAYGAEIVMVEGGAAAFARAEEIVAREGRTFVHPFEGPYTSLGAATLGLEFAAQAGPLDALVIAIGGGGLASGVASAFKLAQPRCKVFGVEPAGADSMHRSFAAGSPQTLASVSTIADSLAPPMALPYSYALCRATVDELVRVEDDALQAAMALLFREMKLVTEPAAAAALAAVAGPLRERLRGLRVGLVICGANIDLDRFADHVRRGEARGWDDLAPGLTAASSARVIG